MASITIGVPFAVTRLREGLFEAIPLTSQDVRTISDTAHGAIRTATKRLHEKLKGQSPEYVARHSMERQVEVRTVSLDFMGDKPSHHRQRIGPRQPIAISVPTFGWTCGPGLVYATAPQYRVQVISTDRDDADQLLAKQIRQQLNAKLAEDAKLLGGIVVSSMGESRVMRTSIEFEVSELSKSKQDDGEHAKAIATLKQIATRWAPTKLRRAYHRDAQVCNLIERIAGDEPRSVLLVGRSGVGKTAIVHEAIHRISTSMLSPPRFYATDGSRLIAGQCGFGMLQEQCLQVATAIERLGAVVHLGNLMQLIESGKINGSGGCGSILTPRLTSGRLIAIVEATPEEIGLAQRSEPRLMASFEIVQVEEPDGETTRSILMDSALNWQAPTSVVKRKRKRSTESTNNSSPQSLAATPLIATASMPQIDVDALIAIDQLHRRFPTDSASPGRPLAFLSGLIGELNSGDTLTVDKVNDAFARQTGLPSFLTDPKSRPDLEQLQRSLSKDVIGQPHAIEVIVDTIATLSTWLSRGDRPLASLLLIGPTGVGKTETAKAIARLIYQDPARMIRIDLSEFSSPDASRRLIGDSCSGEGVLTGAIRAQPFSLVLLDEFEKADRGVFDLLLQVLGEGRLTDGRGRLADFRNSIVLMTSNLGVESYRGTPLGLVDTQADEARRLEKHFDQQVRSFLRPEMYNRIDRVIAYRPLSTDTIKSIALGRLAQVEHRDGMLSCGGRLRVNDEAMARLVSQGYEPQYGARPLARTIEREIVTPLAEALCESRSSDAIVAEVHLEQQNLHVSIAAAPEATHVSPRHSANRVAILNLATQTRRHHQALQRSPTMIALLNRETRNRRLIEQQLRTAKDEAARSRILGSALYQFLQQDQTQLKGLQELGETITELEHTVALAHLRHDTQPLDPLRSRIEDVEQRLIDGVINLIYDGQRLDQPVSLVISSLHMSKFASTLQAYQNLSAKHGWKMQAFALLDGNNPEAIQFKEKMRLGNVEPLFAVASVPKNDASYSLSSPTSSKAENKALTTAVPIPLQDLPVHLDEGLTMLLLEFEGPRAWAYMSGEAGVHTALPANAINKKHYISIVCEAHPLAAVKMTTINDWLDRAPGKAREVRRHFDAAKQSMRDYGLADSFHCPADAQFRIEQAIEDFFMKRIMELMTDSPVPTEPKLD